MIRGPIRVSRAFTLIEVLVVVTIIALLIAILIPSLAKARETTRITKCLANMSNMPKAVLTFAQEHRGFGQLLAEKVEADAIDPAYGRYAYQNEHFDVDGTWLKAWPVAYASHLGVPSLKRNEQFLDLAYRADPNYYRGKFGIQEIFTCPSDTLLVNNVFFPRGNGGANRDLFGLVSYATNEDVFGATGAPPGGSAGTLPTQEGQPWRDGLAADTVPARAKRLEGNLERIERPAEVALFCDGGYEKERQLATLLITNGNPHGPYLENVERATGRLPHTRHTEKGGIAVAFADGSGKFARPLNWLNVGSRRYVKRYTPRVRISPYNVGPITSDYDNPSKWP